MEGTIVWTHDRAECAGRELQQEPFAGTVLLHRVEYNFTVAPLLALGHTLVDPLVHVIEQVIRIHEVDHGTWRHLRILSF